MVQEGGTYQLENAIVGFNESPYKVTSHKHKLSMMHNSTFTKVHLPAIPMNVFEFKPFNEILSSTADEVSTGKTSILNVCCTLFLPISIRLGISYICFCFCIRNFKCYWSCNWKRWYKGNWKGRKEKQGYWSHFKRSWVRFVSFFVPGCNMILIYLMFLNWYFGNILLQKQPLTLLSLGWACWQNCDLWDNE